MGSTRRYRNATIDSDFNFPVQIIQHVFLELPERLIREGSAPAKKVESQWNILIEYLKNTNEYRMPLSERQLGSAPYASNTLTTSTFPRRHASCKAVHPALSLALTSAPALIFIPTTSSYPSLAALCSTVSPVMRLQERRFKAAEINRVRQ